MLFTSGIRINPHKEQSLLDPRIRVLNAPQKIVIPLYQNKHSSAEPAVVLGQRVLRGEKIAEGEYPLFASISGTVSFIGIYPHPVNGISQAIVIESDGRDESVPEVGMERIDTDIEALSSEELKNIALDAGLVDLTENPVPVVSKIKSAPGKIKAVILNGAEDEPYLTSDYLLMFTRQVEILKGLELMVKACGADEGWIAINDNKMDCYEIFASKLFSMRNSKIRLFNLKDTYPQGLSGQILPQIVKNKKKSDFPVTADEVLIFNVATAFAFYEAVKWRKPFMERVVTLAGICLMQPQNVLARIGTLFSEAVDGIGGFLRFPNRVIMGGPMRGTAQSTLDVPILAETTGILCFPKEENSLREASPCIRCGDCIPVCPVSLNPVELVKAASESDWKRAEELSASNCIECGNCSYVCPSKIPMVQWIKEAKSNLSGWK